MSSPSKQRICVDCPPPKSPSKLRPAPHPGPRCTTHHRVVIKERKAKAHERHVIKTYDIEPGFYNRLLAYQGGVCAICKKARGVRKRLGVDHDHKKETNNVRGLLCLNCNQVIARFRDDVELFRSAIAYLQNPPAPILMMSED